MKVHKVNEQEVIHIRVKDTGVGIRKEDQRKLFKLFSRVEDRTKTNQKGIGLGLYISKKMSQRLSYEGDKGLSVESSVGKGSEFFFNIENKQMDT